MFWPENGWAKNRSGSPQKKPAAHFSAFRLTRIIYRPFRAPRYRHERIPRPAPFHRPRSATTADARRGVPDLGAWRAGPAARICPAPANEGGLADRTERTILPRVRDCLAAASHNVLGRGSRTSDVCRILGGGVAAKARQWSERQAPGLDDRSRGPRPCRAWRDPARCLAPGQGAGG